MAKTFGARKRNQTQQQKDIQVKKMRQTKQIKKQQKEAAERDRRATNEMQKRQDAAEKARNFFVPHSSKQCSAKGMETGGHQTNVFSLDINNTTVNSVVHPTVDNSLVVEAASLDDTNPADIIQNLDYDEEDEKANGDSS